MKCGRFPTRAVFAMFAAALVAGCPLPPLERAAGDLAPDFDALDADGDGFLAFGEAAAGSRDLTGAIFAQIDIDGDGHLSPAEVHRAEQDPDRSLRGTWRADAPIREALESDLTLSFAGRRFVFFFGSASAAPGERTPEYGFSGRFSVDLDRTPRSMDLEFDAIEFDEAQYRADFRGDAEAIYADLTPEELEVTIAAAGFDTYDELIAFTLDALQAQVLAVAQDRLDAMIALSPLDGIYADQDDGLAIDFPGLFEFSAPAERPEEFGGATWLFARP